MKHRTDKRCKSGRRLRTTKDPQVKHADNERPEERDDGAVSPEGMNSGTEPSIDVNSKSEISTVQPNGAEDIESSANRIEDRSNEEESDNDLLDYVLDEFDELTVLIS